MSSIKFEWLRDYIEREERITYLKWNLAKSKAELARWVDGDLQNVRLTQGSLSANLENNITLLAKELDTLTAEQDELNSLIQTFKGVDQQIVRLKYIEGLSLEAIAEALGYSESHIQKRHAEIRKNVCFISEYMANIHKYHNELETIYKDISIE